LGSFIFLLDERLRFYHRVVIGKRVERGQNETTSSGFRGHEPKRSERKAMVGLEVMQEAALAPIGKNLVMHVEEDFLGEHLYLKAHLITDPVSAEQAVGMLTPETITKQAALFGQELIGGSSNFRQGNIAVFPSNHMASSRDPYGQIVIFALDLAHREDIKELRVERSSIKLEYQV
jgi:hypothetical protein